ncbi:hypothetical protein NX059_000262 [Plenodomus lindquistii]|nr:hypothetical protein NX059_000262 [Plenodomus lindquistii]
MGLIITTCLATQQYGYDRHMWDVHPRFYVPERKLAFAVYILYVISGGLIKTSVLLFYRRLDNRSVTRFFRYATWISIAGIQLYTFSFVIIMFVGCDPWTAFWEKFSLENQINGYKYHCWVNEGADLVAASTVSAVQDAIAAFLPTTLYWHLQMPRKRKLAVGCVFALGYLVCAVAITRIYYVYRIFDNELYDSTWESWPAWLLAMIEIQLGAIVASAPALKAFVTHYKRAVTSKMGSSASSSVKVASWGQQKEQSKFLGGGHPKEWQQSSCSDERGLTVDQDGHSIVVMYDFEGRNASLASSTPIEEGRIESYTHV